ncbi:pyrroline-5-carboxylate reductase dimerization domain-containing protein [Labrenzia sp. DG1229]|uniref:pyrroline-5-carboxylate reductase family protein n=1 Tax=Labrenzia sp. DG1229 TaxID=681847 RepID=UPI00049160B9|nr:pyrroline-5-carboxylate reductase dimerization domain-containing protein [Labrenzia sp. DG1229]
MSHKLKVGIVGGTGQLGAAMATGWLESDHIRPQDLWISNRSGNAGEFADWPEVNFTPSNQILADACDVIVLSVPPTQTGELDVSARDKLVISVMAGVSHRQIRELAGTHKAVRAMSSPAARQRSAYSAWFAKDGLSATDRRTVQELLSAIGSADEVPDEGQIEVFTVLTGPVPGFAAFFADCLVQYALANNVAPEAAVKSVKQLFLSSGQLMSVSDHPPDFFVKEMVDYGGTTTAGLKKLQELGAARLIEKGLDASLERVRTIVSSD